MPGSSYDPNGSWWALDTAVRDQFDALIGGREPLLPRAPRHVIAVGHVDGRADQRARGRAARTPIDGSLTTCGIVAGGVQLNNYQLDGEYAMTQAARPLASGRTGSSSSTSSDNPGVGLQSGEQLTTIGPRQRRPSRPGGARSSAARLALAMSLMNVADWSPVAMPSAVRTLVAQERGQYDIEF